jgi:hypothetical protein
MGFGVAEKFDSNSTLKVVWFGKPDEKERDFLENLRL